MESSRQNRSGVAGASAASSCSGVNLVFFHVEHLNPNNGLNGAAFYLFAIDGSENVPVHAVASLGSYGILLSG